MLIILMCILQRFTEKSKAEREKKKVRSEVRRQFC